MNDLTPAEVFPPGYFIREEIEARGWNQAELAQIMGRPLSAVSAIILGKRGITADTAKELSEAFGTSAEVWLNLEAEYRLSLSGGPNGAVRNRAKVFDVAPVREMERRGWIKETKSLDELEAELKRFFNTDTLNNIAELAAAARTSVIEEDALTTEQRAWCYRAVHLSKLAPAHKFTRKSFDAGCEKLRTLAGEPEYVKEVPRVLSEMGIRFVLVEHLQRTRIDGATLWPAPNAPVIVLSMRYDRIDYFWHTLCHELSHVRHCDDPTIDAEFIESGQMRRQEKSDIEERADTEAAAMLIPSARLDSFIARVKPLYSKKRIVGFARTMNVHPGIAAGQLQYRGEVKYSANREMLAKVRALITSVALTDGWGHRVVVDF